MVGLMIALVVIVIVVLVVMGSIRIVPQARAVIVERMGAYRATWKTGYHFKIPLIDRMSEPISLKEQVVEFPPEPIVTKDSITMQIDFVVYFQVFDPKAYTYGVEKPLLAMKNLTATTLRSVVGELSIDQTLASRDKINAHLRDLLDASTKVWGVNVVRVELKNIIPPPEVQEAMEKQLKTERESREAILRAEGEKRSAILVAEGERESLILKAEGEKQSAILRAEAACETRIREAEGEAEAIIRLQEATAEGLTKINAAKPSDKAVQLKSYEALVKVAEGNATKIIIPSDLQSLTSLPVVDAEPANKKTK